MMRMVLVIMMRMVVVTVLVMMMRMVVVTKRISEIALNIGSSTLLTSTLPP